MKIIFAEKSDSTVVNEGSNSYKQYGKGLVLFLDSQIAHIIENNLVRKVEFADSTLMYSRWGETCTGHDIMGYCLIGESYSGEVYTLWLVNGYDDLSLSKNHKKITNVTVQQVAQLFRGLSFKELIAQVMEAEREREMDALRAEALVGRKFLQEVDTLLSVNEKAGAGSRRDLRERLLALKS